MGMYHPCWGRGINDADADVDNEIWQTIQGTVPCKIGLEGQGVGKWWGGKMVNGEGKVM